jgi:hypothetical protein
MYPTALEILGALVLMFAVVPAILGTVLCLGIEFLKRKFKRDDNTK